MRFWKRCGFFLLLTCVTIASADDFKFARYRVEQRDGVTALRIRWAVPGAATNGKIAIVAGYPALQPYTTEIAATDTNIVRADAANPQSPINQTEFGTAIPLSGPLSLDSIATLRITTAADIGTPPITISRAIDVDIDAVREEITDKSQVTSLSKLKTDLEAKVIELNGKVPTLSAPLLDGDVVMGKTTILLKASSDQAVKIHAEAYKVVGQSREASPSASADGTAYAYSPITLRLSSLAPGAHYEIDLTPLDIRQNREIPNGRRTLRQAKDGSAIATLPDSTPSPTIRLDNQKEVVVRSEEIEVPVVVSHAATVRTRVQKTDRLGGWTTLKTEVTQVPANSDNSPLPITIKTALEPGNRYRIAVAAASLVDDTETLPDVDAREVTPVSPIASRIELKFVKDGIVFRAPTTEIATIGVRYGSNLKDEVTHKSPAPAANPEVKLPLSEISTPLDFTVVVSAADKSGREYKQVITLAADASDVAAKGATDTQIVKNFATKLDAGQDAKLPVKSILKTGLGSFLSVILKAALPSLGV